VLWGFLRGLEGVTFDIFYFAPKWILGDFVPLLCIKYQRWVKRLIVVKTDCRGCYIAESYRSGSVENVRRSPDIRT